MTALENIADLPVLGSLREQLSNLRSGPAKEVASGHLDLDADIWLSCDPAGQARMTLRPSDGEIGFELSGGDSGRWSCLGMRLPVAALEQARYLGILLNLKSPGLLSYSPTLRYHLRDGEMRDVSTPTPAVMAGGAREILSYIPVDQDLLAASSGCELNMFFHIDAFSADIVNIDVLRML